MYLISVWENFTSNKIKKKKENGTGVNILSSYEAAIR
jgi:hypothetical protein